MRLGEDGGHYQDKFDKLLIHLIREIIYLSGYSRGILETSGCGNHVMYTKSSCTSRVSCSQLFTVPNGGKGFFEKDF